jgi:hypothetical protein
METINRSSYGLTPLGNKTGLSSLSASTGRFHGKRGRTHLALSILVLQVFLRHSTGWLILAIGYHALFNMAAVVGAVRLGPNLTEVLLGIFALISLGLIFRLRTPEPVAQDIEALEEPPPFKPREWRPTDEVLERSRYQ